jgi:predicted PurR-regulated permease PerM
MGIGIGILDALPIFGTGTILIPWAILCFFGKNWGEGLILLALYLICYFMRELLEAKLMGSRVGLTSLETLISMYVGLQLFGIAGLFLGPIGLLIIEDLIKAAEET